MLSYLVASACTAPDGSALYLSVEKQTGQVVVWNQLPNNDSSQLWVPVDLPGIAGTVLLNMQSGMVIAAPDENGPVKMVAPGTMNTQQCLWNLLSNGAVQLTRDNSQNLNVSGNGPYPNGTPILSWNWSGGESNEIWNYTAVIT